MGTDSTGRPCDHPVSTRVFGRLASGEAVTEHTLTNPAGMIVKVLDYGGIVTELHVPDRHGRLADVVLGFDGLAPYESQHHYIGALVGRFAGRIANGRFALNGRDVILARNHGAHHLHGGTKGFDKALWSAESRAQSGGLTLSYRSPDSEEGYPGNLDVRVTYTLTDDNELRVEYAAETDATTVVNLTQHSYFNLSGTPDGDIRSHRLQVRADDILELDESKIPTGIYLPVQDSPFDFRAAMPIGEGLDQNHEQLHIGRGYDHYWVLPDRDDRRLVQVLSLEHEPSGRRLEVLTTEPGVQIYTGNYLNGTVVGKGNRASRPHAAICFETQKFPDAPNHSEFPAATLEPGESFRSVTVFRFQAA